MPIPRGYPSNGYRPGSEQYQEAFYAEPHTDFARGMTAPPTVPTAPGGPMAEPSTPYVDPTFKGSNTVKGPIQLAPTYQSVPQVQAGPQLSSVSLADAAFALAKFAVRLSPQARAALLFLDFGKQVYDYYQLGQSGWSLGGDWTVVANYPATVNPDVGSPVYQEFIWWFNTDYGANSGFYSHASMAALNGTLQGTGPDTYIRQWSISVEPGPPWNAMDPTAWNFETGQIWQGTTTPAPALVDTFTNGYLPNAPDVRIPYKAIPHQDAWDHPLSSRGYEAPAKLQRVPAETIASNGGRTYWVDVPPVGPPTSGSYVPPAGGNNISKPPEPGVREKKITLTGGGKAMRLFGTFTEFSEFVTCMFKSVPLKQRLKDKVTKRRPRKAQTPFMTAHGEIKKAVNVNVGVYKQALYLFEKYNDANIAEAIDCWRSSEASDAVIGKYSSAANNATVKNPYWVSPKGIGGGFGP